MKKLFTFLFLALYFCCFAQITHSQTLYDSITPPAPMSEADTIMRWPDVKAEYPGGMQELMKFLSSELTYPQEALENNIQGTVIVEFIVCKDGTVCNANILKSVHESLDNEAVRVAELMGKWTPGKIDGENVATYFQLPVMYKLQSKGKAKR